MGEMTVLLMAATAMVLALLFFWLSARSRKRTGIPAGEAFYQDLVGQPFPARDLRSLKLGISGKPDCLIRTADGIVPVELKKSKRSPARGEVYPNHMIQNLAYCALGEEQLGERVPYGLVIYAGQQVRRVEFTDSNRRWLMHTIAAFRRLEFESRRRAIIISAAAAPDAACVTSVIRLCVESSHRDLNIRHDQTLHSHACFRGSATIPHASEQTRILPGTLSVEVASGE